MLSWQRSLAGEMCYILSNTSQKGRQIETHCLRSGHFIILCDDVIFFPCPSASLRVIRHMSVEQKYSLKNCQSEQSESLWINTCGAGWQIKIAGEYFNGVKIRDTCDQMPETVFRVIYIVWSFVDWRCFQYYMWWSNIRESCITKFQARPEIFALCN